MSAPLPVPPPIRIRTEADTEAEKGAVEISTVFIAGVHPEVAGRLWVQGDGYSAAVLLAPVHMRAIAAQLVQAADEIERATADYERQKGRR